MDDGKKTRDKNAWKEVILSGNGCIYIYIYTHYVHKTMNTDIRQKLNRFALTLNSNILGQDKD
jgi:hypothetical protein